MRVLPFKIVKNPHENIVLQIDSSQSFYNRLHQHEEIQLSYIVKGKGTLVVGNTVRSYQEGNIVGIGSHLPHVFKSREGEEKSHMISLFFTKGAFGNVFFEQIEMQALKPLFEALPYGILVSKESTAVSHQFKLLNNTDAFSFFVQFIQLLHTLSGLKLQRLTRSPIKKVLSNQQGSRLQHTVDYVLENYHKGITLGEISNIACMSPNAFCRFFKQRSNKSFFTFVNEVRVAHACHYLLYTSDLSVSEIALKCGYGSISNFNKHFLQLKGTNPTNFRKKYA